MDGPDVLVPLGSPARRLRQSDHEARESLSLRFEMTDRFLRVQFHDYLEKPDRGTISLTLAGHTADVTGYDWARLPDGHVIVITGSRDGTVRRWDISSIMPESSQENEQAARVALHRIVSMPLDDGTPLGLTMADDSDVALWDLRTGEFVGDLEEREVPACAIDIARPKETAPSRSPSISTTPSGPGACLPDTKPANSSPIASAGRAMRPARACPTAPVSP